MPGSNLHHHYAGSKPKNHHEIEGFCVTENAVCSDTEIVVFAGTRLGATRFRQKFGRQENASNPKEIGDQEV